MTKDEIKLTKRYVDLVSKQEDQELFDELFGKGMFKDEMVEEWYNLVTKAFDRLEELEALQEQLDERWNNCIGEHKTRIEQLENGLDKACKKIAELCVDAGECSTAYCPLKDKEACDSDCDYAGRWKDWALGYGKHR